MKFNGTNSSQLNEKRKQPLPCDIQGTFGWNLRNERNRQRVSQEKLAERAGCSVDTVKRYEKGIIGMRLDMAWFLAEALQVPLESLLPKRDQEESNRK